MAVVFLDQVSEWIGSEPDSEFQLAALAEEGLPLTVVKLMVDHGLSSGEVYSIVIPQRTLKHRKSRHERLSREESDRAIRAARVLSHARSVMGTDAEALAWMRAPKQRFEGRTPLQMLNTESGGRLVDEMLVQIDEGMFA